MKVLITGAHFTPAQAVIEELLKDNETKIVYIGRKYTQEGDKALSVESQVLPTLGVKFIPIIAGRVRRIIAIQTIISLLKIPIGFVQGFYYVAKEQPDVIVSFGGYVAVPIVIAGWLLSIPVLVHEQTLISGLANTVSNFFADRIAVSFGKEYDFDKDKLILTGNPMRKSILTDEIKPSDELKAFLIKKKSLPLILITGGNQGAHIINEAIGECIEDLCSKAFVIHQTGDSRFKDFEALAEKKSKMKNSDRYMIKKWIDADDMAVIFRNTDVAISRGGANTLLELAYFSIPTIIIPLPFIYKDEQTKNAKFFCKRGLGEIIKQDNLTSKTLIDLVNKMLKDLKEYKKNACKSKDIVIPDAGATIALEIKQLAAQYD